MKRLFCLLSALALLLQPVHAAQPPQRIWPEKRQISLERSM